MPAPVESDVARLLRLYEQEARVRIVAAVRARRSTEEIRQILTTLATELDPIGRFRGILGVQMDSSLAEANTMFREQYISDHTRLDRAPLEAIAQDVLQGVTRRQADLERRAIDEATRAIRERMPLRELENRLAGVLGSARHQIEAVALTGTAGINRMSQVVGAEAAGIDEYTYDGPDAEREFCEDLMKAARAGQTWTRAEIERMDNGQGLRVIAYCGGYRCKHRWRVVVVRKKAVVAARSPKATETPKAKAEPAKAAQQALNADTFAGVRPATLPAGEKFRQNFTVEKGKHHDAVIRALHLIESVHGGPKMDLKPIPVRQHGSFQYQGMYYTSWSRKQSIEIRPGSVEKEATMVHEFGHWLDDMAIGKPGKFASGKGAELAEWRAAVNASRAVQELKKINRRGGAVKRKGPDGVERTIYENTAYLLEPAELFARSYAQYIATVTSNTMLQEQLQHVRDTRPTPYWQWDTDDFEPIRVAFDNLFASQGWLELKP